VRSYERYELGARLVEADVMGVVSWCFADYHPSLSDKLPSSEFWHEYFFGIGKRDESLKPHACMIRDFAARYPMTMPAKTKINLPDPSAEYYQNTLEKKMN